MKSALTDKLFDQTFRSRSFSGCDMTAYINGKRCGTLQAVQVSITRETLPQFVMGSPEMVSVTRGKRAIAGTLVFTQFDRHAILGDDLFTEKGKSIMGNTMEELLSSTRYDLASGDKRAGIGTVSNGSIQEEGLAGVAAEVRETWDLVMKERKLNYADSIPPFDICVTMVNENGAGAYMTIEGVVLINESFGFTMEDLSSETAHTFIARKVRPLTSFDEETKI